jgi:hypothetical protein
MANFSWALAASVVVANMGQAPHEKKAPFKPNEVEARLADGSKIRMVILQETLPVITKYGTLNIPTQDVRRIEFGIRATEGIGKRVQEAIERLGHAVFKEREDAVKELVAIGPPAYAPLTQAAKSLDVEVAQRARTALDRIRQRYPENQLRVREDDLVQTAEFTLMGRITTKTIKARTAVFGEALLNISDLRGIRWLGHQAELELSMDGAKYATGGNQWLDTGIELSGDDELAITGSGQIDLMTGNNGQYVTGPAGNTQWGGGFMGHPPGTLLGKIGANGSLFTVGESYKGMAKAEGKLYLMISPSPWARNGGANVTGSYKVNIVGGRDTLDR